MRRNQFTVDAESVQGNAGAEVTFRALKVREVREYRETEQTDTELLVKHIVSWSGIVDDSGKELPCPADDPEAMGELFLHERSTLMRLLFVGPDGATAKN